MAPVEITPTGAALRPLVSPRLGVPPGVDLLDAGVPWPRDEAELGQGRAELVRRLQVMTAGPSRDASDLTGAERYTLGARAAMRWTLGDAARAPMSRQDVAVTGAQIREELRLAESLVESRLPSWDYATGALNWLLWVTGASEAMTYPGS